MARVEGDEWEEQQESISGNRWRFRGLMVQGRTYQQDLNTAEDVHGPRESGAQVEADPDGAPKLGPQGARDHVVRTSGCRRESKSQCQAPPRASSGRRLALSPGTTPLVAMALMEMAVSMVWKRRQNEVTGDRVGRRDDVQM